MHARLHSLSLAVLALAGLAAVPPSVEAAPPKPPKLVVTILVDQLRYDYLDRFYDQFSEGGFRLLVDKGAFMTFAHYSYMPTITGPGHASFISGAPPAVHGIISNDWFDKRTLKNVNCVADPDVEPVGAEGAEKRSPRNFVGSNFSDEMRLRFHSKIVGVSLKDRGAILPAGKKPAGAYWFDSRSGNFITSTYYMTELPEWVRKFNDQKHPAQFVGQTWKRLLPPEAYHWPDQAEGEGVMPGEQAPVFDHVVAPSKKESFETLVPTPFGNELLAEFALTALEAEKLGQGSQPDLLSISFSSVDAAGHRFGPYSQEVQDMVLRLDRELEKIFNRIDQVVGLENVVMMLTADHGVCPTPEFAREQGLAGERVDTVELIGDLQAKLNERFGAGRYLLTPRIVDGNLFFNHAVLRDKQIDPDVMARFIRDWAVDTGKFYAGFTRTQLLDGRAPGEVGRLVLNGFNPERSGDVVLVYKPFTFPSGGKTGTTHGAPWSYDTHIPIIFYGTPFKPGRYPDEFYITDIAATLSVALGVNEPSGSIGKPALRILAEQTAPTTPAKTAPKAPSKSTRKR